MRRHRGKTGIAAGILITALTCIFLGTFAREIFLSRQDFRGVRIGNSEAVAEKIRTGLKHRAYKLHISFRAHTKDEERIKALVDDLLEKALYESDDPVGGDYIRYQLGGYKMNYDVEETLLGYNYRMELMPTCYSSAQEEEYVDEEVDKILKELSADDLTEEERVRAVHDYVVQLLSYDSVHKLNTQNHGKTTAYYALRYHQAVCQGYAVLCYRLLKELGVECRIVTGLLVPEGTEEGTAERHAWLMVTVNGENLYMDPTLDDVNSSYDWYLKSAEDFDKDHIRKIEGTQ